MTSLHLLRPRSRRQFLRDVSVAGAVLGGSLLAACQPSAPAAPAGGAPNAAATQAAAIAQAAPTQAAAAPAELPRNETLYIGGFQWDPPTSFNPLMTGLACWPVQGAPNNPQMHLYEALFGFNLQTGNLDPLLAKDLSWPNPKTAVVTLQSGTHWQDGQALNAEDVVYTYQLGKNYKDVYYSTLWDYLAGVTAKDDHTVQFDLNPDKLNPGMVKFYLGSVYVLPKHVWQNRESGDSPAKLADMNPVGSGPYKLQSASPERVVLVRDDSYWGTPLFGTPKPRYLVHPIFKSNDDGNLAFQRGELDISQQFTPQIWQMWEQQRLPVGTWFKQEPYHLPGGIPMVHIHVSKPGLSDPRVRRALAHAINYPQIAAAAMSRYSVAARSSLLVPGGIEQKFIDDSLITANGWTYDPQKATQILEQDVGAKKGSDGIYSLPDGTRLGPWKVICPYGWTDWMTALELVSQGAKAAGLDISTEFPQAGTVNSRIGNADFELGMWPVSGVSAASPWLRFREVLDSYPHQLSGGMRQRVVATISTLLNPRVLIADEPTSALDVSSQAGLVAMLRDLLDRRLVAAIVLISHDLPMLSNLAQRIAVMYAGRVVETAPIAEIVGEPRHPYTRALIGSALVPDPRLRGRRVEGISGAPPDLRVPPSGCRFHPWCPVALEVCATCEPPEVLHATGFATCWRVAGAPKPEPLQVAGA
jgi:peptide/nickel transport system substrate-binding protein